MRLPAATILALALLAVTVPAAAKSARDRQSDYSGLAWVEAAQDLETTQNGCTSLGEAIEQVRRQTGGQILSAETKVSGGREVHHIKVLTRDGKVRTHKVQGCRRDR